MSVLGQEGEAAGRELGVGALGRVKAEAEGRGRRSGKAVR